jgi:hypothetical protein
MFIVLLFEKHLSKELRKMIYILQRTDLEYGDIETDM